MGVFGFGIGAGFGLAGYLNLPPYAARNWTAATAVFLIGLGACWIGGRRYGRSQAQMQVQHQEQAQEQEQVQAQQQAVVVNVLPSTGAAATATAAAHGPQEALSASWSRYYEESAALEGDRTVRALSAALRRVPDPPTVDVAPSGGERRQALDSYPPTAAPVGSQPRSPAKQDRRAVRPGEG